MYKKIKILFLVVKNIASVISGIAAAIFFYMLLQDSISQTWIAISVATFIASFIEVVAVFAMVFAMDLLYCNKSFQERATAAIPLFLVAITFYACNWYATSIGFGKIIEINNPKIKIETTHENRVGDIELKYKTEYATIAAKYDSIAALALPTGAIARTIRANTLDHYSKQIAILQTSIANEMQRSEKKLKSSLQTIEVKSNENKKRYEGIATFVMICVFGFNICYVFYRQKSKVNAPEPKPEITNPEIIKPEVIKPIKKLAVKPQPQPQPEAQEIEQPQQIVELPKTSNFIIENCITNQKFEIPFDPNGMITIELLEYMKQTMNLKQIGTLLNTSASTICRIKKDMPIKDENIKIYNIK